jgi:hypothetical protein
MTHQDEARFPAGSKIILIMPPFSLFITGDLSYYADMLGMPSSSSYWCPWCLLSHADWNQPPETYNAEERTLEFLTEVSLAVKNDSERKLKPIDRKGVTCERHYKSLSPLNFVLPLLHLEIGMVNQSSLPMKRRPVGKYRIQKKDLILHWITRRRQTQQ